MVKAIIWISNTCTPAEKHRFDGHNIHDVVSDSHDIYKMATITILPDYRRRIEPSPIIDSCYVYVTKG